MDNSKIHFLSDPSFFREKEKTYLEVRRREGRVLPDESVRALPFVSKSNPYAREWRWRVRSFHRFLSSCKELSALRFSLAERTVPYRMTKKSEKGVVGEDANNGRNSYRMTKKEVVGEDANNGKFRILDLGCGNGWLANRLAENPDWDVWAVDVNEVEMAQGVRLFGRKNLRFVYADVLQGVLPENYFDVALLAASAQYFPDLKQLVFSLKNCLKPGGIIHIFDSPFYKNEKEQASARQRTLEYYTKLGVPEMAAFYHHHLWADAEKLGGKNLNDRLDVRLLQKIKWLAPFAWVQLTK